MTTRLERQINRDLRWLIQHFFAGQNNLARQNVHRLNATGGANNRRYPSTVQTFSSPTNRQILSYLRSGFPPIQINNATRRNLITRLLGGLNRNQPNVGWSHYRIGTAPFNNNSGHINQTYKRLVNAVRNGNANEQVISWINLNRTLGSNNRRYPTITRMLGAAPNRLAWVGLSRQGLRMTTDPVTANQLEQWLRNNQPAVWGGASGIAAFNRAPRTRETFNRFAQLWFGQNMRGRRLQRHILNNFNATNQNLERKKELLRLLLEELRGGASGGSSGGSNNNTIAAFNRSPRTLNTLRRFAGTWGFNIANAGNRYTRLALKIHPNRQNQANANRMAKAHKLFILLGQLKNEGVIQ